MIRSLLVAAVCALIVLTISPHVASAASQKSLSSNGMRASQTSWASIDPGVADQKIRFTRSERKAIAANVAYASVPAGVASAYVCRLIPNPLASALCSGVIAGVIAYKLADFITAVTASDKKHDCLFVKFPTSAFVGSGGAPDPDAVKAGDWGHDDASNCDI